MNITNKVDPLNSKEQTKENKFSKIGHKENYQVLRCDEYKFPFYFCMAFNCCIRLLMIFVFKSFLEKKYKIYNQ